MRRTIRHMVTIITLERWTINWEKPSEEGTEGQDHGAERLFFEVNRELPESEHAKGKLSDENKGE
ncbi:MAG: hypothetical protein ACRDFQ_06335 [Anaerolineales bacterium]